MQARAHGLAVVPSPSLCSSELMARAIKQEPILGDCPSDLYQKSGPDMSPTTTLDLNNGTIHFNDSPLDAGEPGAYGSNKASTKLKDIIDNTLSPISSLLSSVSPDASNSSSSRRSSSSSMEENNHRCQHCPRAQVILIFQHIVITVIVITRFCYDLFHETSLLAS